MYKNSVRLWSHIELSRRLQLSGLFLLMLIVSVAEVLSIGAVVPFLGVLTAPQWVFDHSMAQPLIRAFEISQPKELVLPLTLLFSAAALFSGIMRIVYLWVQIKLSQAVGADFSIRVFLLTLHQPYPVHAKRNSSEVVAVIANKITIVVHQFIWPLLTIIGSFFMLAAILGTLLAIDPVLAFGSFVGFGGIYGIVVLLTKSRLHQYSKSISHNQAQVYKTLQEGLGSIRDVLIDGTQSTYGEYFRRADIQLRQALANSQIVGSAPRYGIEAVGMVLIAGVAYLMVAESRGLESAVPVLGALALGAQRLLPVLQQSYAGFSSMRSAKDVLADVLELLDQPQPVSTEIPRPSSLIFKDSIKLDNVAFRYSSKDTWVLRGVSLCIPKGSRVGFIGSTGSGKSTLLDLIMGLLYPSTGELSIDDIAVTDENHRAWQRHIAHVPQDIFLSDTTIFENIAFGVPREQIDPRRVYEAAQRAQLAETIEALEHQYDTMVGERGIRLSGGQRQRIGIARALYKRANVIVLDEATSALDSNTEDLVMESIERLGEELTIIIVAHRLSTLKNCDQIFELIDGRINRSGNYTEVVGSKAN